MSPPKSDIIKYFDVRSSTKTPLCRLCKKIIKTSGNTSNMRKHIMSRHKSTLQLVSLDSESQSVQSTSTDNTVSSVSCISTCSTSSANSSVSLNSDLSAVEKVNTPIKQKLQPTIKENVEFFVFIYWMWNKFTKNHQRYCLHDWQR